MTVLLHVLNHQNPNKIKPESLSDEADSFVKKILIHERFVLRVHQNQKIADKP